MARARPGSGIEVAAGPAATSGWDATRSGAAAAGLLAGVGHIDDRPRGAQQPAHTGGGGGGRRTPVAGPTATGAGPPQQPPPAPTVSTARTGSLLQTPVSGRSS